MGCPGSRTCRRQVVDVRQLIAGLLVFLAPAAANEPRFEVAQSLLQRDMWLHMMPRTFGPDGCVSLARSQAGTCVIRTDCEEQDISDTEFSFVCSNPDLKPARELHSFGKGGFEGTETFDTHVQCAACLAADDKTMRLAGGPLLQDRTVASAPVAAYFGPAACVKTYLSGEGKCIIETRCAGVDISNFDVGITCVDETGGYTRYRFGKSFGVDEVFDTRIKCKSCLGVGDDHFVQRRGVVPKGIVDDVNSLRLEVKHLRGEVQAIIRGKGPASTKEANTTAAPPSTTEVSTTEAPVETTVAKTTEAPVETTASNTTEAPVETTAASTTEAPVETTVANTTQAPVETTASNTTEAPVETTVANTTEAAVETTASNTTEAPVETTVA
eukprot:CAMPEP_0170591250 /NCGR_PEP_ID=MMETSP0224-20130122/12303_1 /TAXON_ID=285029 /ORGANISM="Togula jolla, Strain CCCM 725" /LENGTH=384 /DNA_ID=CAMNT_0010915101 /DNA_START=52 /DNA_END=1202 /DNA_ORIENTATION=+